MAELDVVVIGAGPYGLSTAAHLAHAGLRTKVFGGLMDTWRNRMPDGMYLKSEGFASSLSDPAGALTLRRFCREHGLPYGDLGVPVSREIFISYGEWFAAQTEPDLADSTVESVTRDGGGFRIVHAGGSLAARAVVVASGVPQFKYLPPELSGLPGSVVTHAADHAALADFAGRSVAVVGAGQSALETAALLHEQGARPHVIVRKRTLAWNGNPNLEPQSLLYRLRWPISPLGTGLQLWAYAHLSPAYRYLPPAKRIAAAWATLGPAGAWWLRERIDGHVPILTDHRVRSVEPLPEGARLTLESRSDAKELHVDHVIAGTGYRVDMERFAFLAPELRREVALFAGSPRLNTAFESSAPGLYFIGISAAQSFGPVMRFVCGTPVAARRVTAHIARRRARPDAGRRRTAAASSAAP